MVYVEGGSFEMGTYGGSNDEKPRHKIVLTGFSIGRYEVTQAMWTKVMGNDPDVNYFAGCDSCPVEKVSYLSIALFLEKLNALTGQEFRLPTEAEWEFAARGGVHSKSFRYSGGNNINDIAWYELNAGAHTHVVGTKTPNELGIYDMSGNVWEWCSDWYAPDYYAHSSMQNPEGPATARFRVIRGGSWYYDKAGLRTTDRDKGDPALRYGYVGFRLAQSQP